MATRLEHVVLIILLAWAVLASALAAHNYLRAEALSAELSSLRGELMNVNSTLAELRKRVIWVDVVIDYGNGTLEWHNYTLLPRGSTVFKALLFVASNVEYKHGKWGVYVTSINGVSEKIMSKSEGYSWMWYIYERDKGEWALGPVAADKYELPDGAIIKWAYVHWKF
ncbi:MAG: hypothetical protein DRJ96_00710 [Thermoprotei archaeon]|nr:MAG: hypothetical protein DRJ67_02540 [Thermoprotei archaeon]RLE98544.1 MAG: hypothetical protein DRJ96_00710 [Thermoprotei archaeon]